MCYAVRTLVFNDSIPEETFTYHQEQSMTMMASVITAIIANLPKDKHVQVFVYHMRIVDNFSRTPMH